MGGGAGCKMVRSASISLNDKAAASSSWHFLRDLNWRSRRLTPPLSNDVVEGEKDEWLYLPLGGIDERFSVYLDRMDHVDVCVLPGKEANIKYEATCYFEVPQRAAFNQGYVNMKYTGVYSALRT
jgi:hypothetical protein